MSNLAYLIIACCENDGFDLSLDIDKLHAKCQRLNASFTNALSYAQKLGLHNFY